MLKLTAICACALTLVSPLSFAHKANEMGCSWKIPERFKVHSKTSWESKSGEPAVIIFREELFDEVYVENSVTPTDIKQKVSLRQADNGFEIIVYSEYFEGRESLLFPSWVVVKKDSGKGAFYMSGLELDEVQHFVSSCMPNIS